MLIVSHFFKINRTHWNQILEQLFVSNINADGGMDDYGRRWNFAKAFLAAGMEVGLFVFNSRLDAASVIGNIGE